MQFGAKCDKFDIILKFMILKFRFPRGIVNAIY